MALLERRNRGAHCGLREVKGLGGARYVLSFGDCLKNPKLLERHLSTPWVIVASGIGRGLYDRRFDGAQLIGKLIDCIDHFIRNYSLERFIDPCHMTARQTSKGRSR